MGKFYTDYERLEFVKKFKESRLSSREFALANNLAVSTFRDWVHAFEDINGGFINIGKALEAPGNVTTEKDYTVSVLSSDNIRKKSSHFTRFDHSIVVIELPDGLKITTSLEQAEKILENHYDRQRKG